MSTIFSFNEHSNSYFKNDELQIQYIENEANQLTYLMKTPFVVTYP